MGDRYCDGVEDPDREIINDSACPQGFDKRFCPKRFKCDANGNISLDVVQVCDGAAHCDDRSDERDCASASNFQSVFSFDTEIIAESFIKAAFYIIGFVVVFGNCYVIIITIVSIKTKKALNSVAFHHIIILNTSIADTIMSIYLLTVAVHSVLFSGTNSSVDLKWRSSLSCSVLGSLAVISSKASCFLIAVLTAFSLKTITHAFQSLTASMRPWKFFVIASWLFSLFISVVPMLNLTSQ